ncbi:MAG: hypothetical protein JSS27_11615 [Planctomycetes bacterium]|nr:hypothetical protein [Planctomycetota bacterium]
MKVRLLSAAALLGLMISGGSLKADNLNMTGNYDQSGAVTPTSFAGDSGCGGCGDCDACKQGCCDNACGNGCCDKEGCNGGCGNEGCCDTGCCGGSGLTNLLRGRLAGLRSCLPPTSDCCPTVGVYAISGYDSWRGPSQGTFAGNNGGNSGVNMAFPLLRDRGIAFQVGGTFGLYNWNGNAAATGAALGGPVPVGNTNQQMQSQLFLTYGFFRRADTDRRISWGVVQDWMVVNNFGVAGDSFSLSQFRGQVAYAMSDRNEVGLWGSLAVMGGGSTLNGDQYRSVQQINAFYHRKFARGGADGWFYIGLPETYRLAGPSSVIGIAGVPTSNFGGGSLGCLTLGTNVIAPINDRVSLYANWAYLAPSSAYSASAAADQIWNLQFGFMFYPGNAARSSTVAGRKFMPYMPVANNGTFMVDTNNVR